MNRFLQLGYLGGVCVCMCVHPHTCMYVVACATKVSLIPSRQGLSLKPGAWNFLVGWLTMKFWHSPVSISATLYPALAFWHGSWIVKLGSHACAGNTLTHWTSSPNLDYSVLISEPQCTVYPRKHSCPLVQPLDAGSVVSPCGLRTEKSGLFALLGILYLVIPVILQHLVTASSSEKTIAGGLRPLQGDELPVTGGHLFSGSWPLCFFPNFNKKHTPKIYIFFLPGDFVLAGF